MFMSKIANLIENLFKKFSVNKKTKKMSGEKNNPAVDILSKNSFLSDSPLTESTKDEFKRRPFAQKLAKIILSHLGSDSLVIGINGKWGEGKTTVLKFIENEIKEDPNKVICIWFNPWVYKDEDLLLLHFFNSLSTELQKSLKSSKEVVGALIKNGSYVFPTFDVSMPDGSTVGINIGESLERFGDNLSSVDNSELKTRLEKILKALGKRIVILMDDIDRLDKSEIQNIFKLIKLMANFPYTNYILTFDQEMVSKALGEQYGGGSEEGCNFLEKIIQVPINLPLLDKASLRTYCFNIINEVFKMSKVEPNEDQAREYARCFVNFLEIRLKTPRMAKRYGNLLTFILPLIGNEVNLVDLMLIEGARVFYPDLYTFIRTKQDLFLGLYLDSLGRKPEVKTKIVKYINGCLENLNEDEKDAARELIKYLFPTLEWVFGGAVYDGLQWEEKWAEDKRVASRAYYRRYFTYSVPEGDISDEEIEGFIVKLKDSDINTIISEIRKLVGETRAEIFVSKLKAYEKKFTVDVARNLSLAISKLGNIFPDPDMMFSVGPFSQAAILIGRLIKLVPQNEGRFDLAKTIITEGDPLYFVSECFLWIKASKEHEENRLLTKEEEKQLGAIIANRVEALSKNEVIFLSFPKAAQRFLSMWSQWGDKKKVQQYLADLINTDSKNAILLIRSFLSRSYGEDGVRLKSDFDRNGYEVIKQLIDPEILIKGLTKLFGELDGKTYRHLEDTKGEDEDKILAEQFVSIHNYAKSENK